MKEKFKKYWFTVVCAIMILIIVFLFIYTIIGNRHKDIAINTEVYTEDLANKASKYVVEKKVIDTDILKEKLTEVGFLVTEEYHFTQVEKYESTKTYWKFFTSEKEFTYSYDGDVTAGVDFSKIKIEKDDDAKTVDITIPKAEIKYINIDYESFKIYSEKESLWNKITLDDYNTAQIEFQSKAQQSAEEKGVLENADKNAKNVVEKMVTGLVDTSEYTVRYQ